MLQKDVEIGLRKIQIYSSKIQKHTAASSWHGEGKKKEKSGGATSRLLLERATQRSDQSSIHAFIPLQIQFTIEE